MHVANRTHTFVSIAQHEHELKPAYMRLSRDTRGLNLMTMS